MACFRVWLRTDDPARIPDRRILVVEEPGRRSERSHRSDSEVDALWYPVAITHEAAVRLGPPVDVLPPPPLPPSPPSEDDRDDARGSGRGGTGAPGAGFDHRAPSSSPRSPAGSSAASAPSPANQRNVQTGALPSQCGPVESLGADTIGSAAAVWLSASVGSSEADSVGAVLEVGTQEIGSPST